MLQPLNQTCPQSSVATLVGIDDRRVFNLKDEDTFLGRSIDNDIVLCSDLSLSRRHAVITFIDGKYYLRDLRSSNGTLLNGQVLEGMIELKPDDEIYLGRTRMLFSPSLQKLHNTPPFGADASTHILKRPLNTTVFVAWQRLKTYLRKYLANAPKHTKKTKEALQKLRANHRDVLLKAIQR
jgi:pSer/pThr/pTyr-binding forkhead associated (FHA) protein